MKKDVKVGVVLVVIILAIIGVFLSTKLRLKNRPFPSRSLRMAIRRGN